MYYFEDMYTSYTLCFKCDFERGNWKERQLVGEEVMRMDGRDTINTPIGGPCLYASWACLYWADLSLLSPCDTLISVWHILQKAQV